MRVSYNWLQEYVDLKGVSPAELGDRMTLTGVAVEHLDVLGQGIEKVVTGKLTEIVRHPNADKLLICTVNIGAPEGAAGTGTTAESGTGTDSGTAAGTETILQIVTGAPNVKVGQVVPVALVGAKLPIGLAIKKSKLRGVESFGMLCSAEELAIEKKLLSAEQQEGILILPPDTPVGVDIRTVLGLDDTVLELELTPNRADCLSMVGVAREVAAVLDSSFRGPDVSAPPAKGSLPKKAKVTIEAPELCGRYVAKLVKNVRIAPSPVWMQKRLRAAGVRPINNVVDVTNYIMMEMGQPLHAFDYETLTGGEIIVRRARAGEELVSLDGQTRKLDEEMLVIADAAKPVAIAGVMGGLETEVTGKTTQILIEAAYFNGTSIRRTSRKLGLRSESSHRFEKGINPGGCLEAAERAARLLAEVAGGEPVKGLIDITKMEIKEQVLTLSLKRLEKYMGAPIPGDRAAAILRGLQFKVEEQPVGGKPAKLLVTVPTARQDITLEEDLIEEVIRIYGYDKVPTTLPIEATTQGRKTLRQTLEEKVKDVMVGSGLTEVINLSFINSQLLDAAGITEPGLREAVVIQNPLSEEQGLLRTTLLPGILEVLKRNASRRVKDAAVYELGRAFWPTGEGRLPEEPLILAIGTMGVSTQNWTGAAQPYDFYFVKGVLETLLNSLGVKNFGFEREAGNPTFHPGRTAVLMLDEVPAGVVGQIHPDAAENFGLPEETCLCELNLEKTLAQADLAKAYRTLPRFPGVDRDLAIVVNEEVPVAQVSRLITQAGGELLESVHLFDVFRGKQIEAGKKSLALSLHYQALDRTLTDEEVNALQAKVAETLGRQVGAILR